MSKHDDVLEKFSTWGIWANALNVCSYQQVVKRERRYVHPVECIWTLQLRFSLARKQFVIKKVDETQWNFIHQKENSFCSSDPQRVPSLDFKMSVQW